MKRIISCILTVVMLVSCFTVAVSAEGGFSDISGHWAQKSIEWAVENNITEGTSNATFSPELKLTRGMFVTFLYRLNSVLGNDNSSSGQTPFTDVAGDTWYTAAVAWAYERGLVTGVTETQFAPADAITRRDIAVLAARYMTNILGADVYPDNTYASFDDAGEIPAYAKDAIQLVCSASVGIMSGDGSGRFHLEKTATRAECVTIIKRLYDFKNNMKESGDWIGDTKYAGAPSMSFNMNDYFISGNISEGLYFSRDYGQIETIRAAGDDEDSAYFGIKYAGFQMNTNGSALYMMLITNDVLADSRDSVHLLLDPGADAKKSDGTDTLIDLTMRRDNTVTGTVLGGAIPRNGVSAHCQAYSETQTMWEICIGLGNMGVSAERYGLNLYAVSYANMDDADNYSVSYVKRTNNTFGVTDAYRWDYFTTNSAPKRATVTPDDPDNNLNVVLLTNGDKVCRDDLLEDNGRTKLTAQMARNESEGLQFLVWNKEGAEDVTFTVSDLINDNGEKLKTVGTYREHYINIENGYTAGAPNGMFPDALIPLYDGSDGGFDNHLCDVAANQNQGFWFTVSSAENQTAGTYKGIATISYAGGADIAVPVEVTVWDITIPTTPSSKTCFDSYYIIDYYTGDDGTGTNRFARDINWIDTDRTRGWNIEMMYYQFFLDYRISGNKIPGTNPNYAADKYDEVEELTVKYGSDERVSAFRFPLRYSYSSGDVAGDDLTLDVNMYRALEEAGIADKTFIYEVDEPNTTSDDTNEASNAKRAYISQLKVGMAKLERRLGGDVHIPSMITTDPVAHPELADKITDWCPNWGKMTHDEMRSFKTKLEAKGCWLWSYTCCGPTWPATTYQIPDSLLSPRLAHWMQYDDGATGEIYWQTTNWFWFYDKPSYRDVWNDACAFNYDTRGDGYLVYPGYQEDGIVNRNIPIPTVRLESVRDGLEDYELFVMMDEKLQAIMTRLGLTDMDTNDLLDTYYQAEYMTPETGYTNFASFDRENSDLLLDVRAMLAEDIMRDTDDTIVAVNTIDKTHKEIVVYTDTNETVTVDGKKLGARKSGDHYVYTCQCTANTDTVEYKTVTVGDDSYQRILNYKY